MDWDLRLKSQMVDFARGTRSILQNPQSATNPTSPYGDDWDILWPGHCGEILPEGEEAVRDMKMTVSYNDATVAPKEHQPWLKALSDYPDHTRIVHTSGGPLCTFAYAVSFKGAQKIMAEIGIKGSNYKFDNALSDFCKYRTFGAKCVSVQPMLFFHHRPAGKIGKDSDISAPSDGDTIREKGYTENIVWSIRLNIENLLVGNRNWVMQW